MDVVSKLWGFCNTLRHDGINYGDYIEQLTYLLFLKMAEEKGLEIPAGFDWASMRERSGIDLLSHYVQTLTRLGEEKGILGQIFTGALSRFREPVNLKKLIALIDETEWSALDVDLKGDAYEGLLQKYAAEQKGAGQFFTPRPLIRSVVRCLQPDVREATEFTVHDPASGTGGFLIGAAEWMLKRSQGRLSREDQIRLKHHMYSGGELVLETRRLALMNLYLHEVEGEVHFGDSIAEGDPGKRFNMILTNPPFGTKGAGEVPHRDDFTIVTSNKQLNFIQHVLTILKPGGRAAMVLPDNVLFEENAGRDVRALLMQDAQLHTILRLPVGTFTPYSPGVKANVFFFRKGLPTDEVWFYDLRTNVPKVTKRQPLTEDSFADFVSAYGSDPTPKPGSRSESDRFRRFTRDELAGRDDNLDIFWLKDENLDDPNDLPEAEDLLGEAMTKLETAVDALNELGRILGNGNEREA